MGGLLTGTRRSLIVPREQELLRLGGLKFEMDCQNERTLFQESTLATPARTGDPVGGVVDGSGSGNTASQTTTAAKPTLAVGWNGLPVLSFDGGDWLACNALASYVSGSDKPFTVIIAHRFTGATTLKFLFSFGRAATNNTTRVLGTTSGSLWQHYSNDDTDTALSTGAGAVNTDAHVIVLLFSGNTVTIFVDGVTIQNEIAQNVGVCTLDQATIGVWRTFGTLANYFIGQIGQLAVLNRRITNDEAKYATGILGKKWEIATL